MAGRACLSTEYSTITGTRPLRGILRTTGHTTGHGEEHGPFSWNEQLQESVSQPQLTGSSFALLPATEWQIRPSDVPSNLRGYSGV